MFKHYCSECQAWESCVFYEGKYRCHACVRRREKIRFAFEGDKKDEMDQG